MIEEVKDVKLEEGKYSESEQIHKEVLNQSKSKESIDSSLNQSDEISKVLYFNN